MSAPTFDAHSSVCPICRRSGVTQSHKLLSGLLTCPSCRERLVISWSGHYVRDPFTFKHLAAEKTLRRESRPFFRLLRDLKLTYTRLFVLILVGLFSVGFSNVLLKKIAASDGWVPPSSSVNNSPTLPPGSNSAPDK